MVPVALYVECFSGGYDKWPRFRWLVDFWRDECAERVGKKFSSQQQTEAHATLMLKVFAVQVRKRTSARLRAASERERERERERARL